MSDSLSLAGTPGCRVYLEQPSLHCKHCHRSNSCRFGYKDLLAYPLCAKRKRGGLMFCYFFYYAPAVEEALIDAAIRPSVCLSVCPTLPRRATAGCAYDSCATAALQAT